MRKILILLLLLYFTCFYTFSATFDENRIATGKHKVGFAVGYGNQLFWDVTYNYQLVLYSLQYQYTFYQKNSFSSELVIQPQYNTANFLEDTPKYSFEYGVNVGALLRKELSDFSVFAMLSAGPHYVSAVPSRQANGFIFSDNLVLGASYMLTKNLGLDVRGGVRHISNAGFTAPNGGINNTIFQIGFFVLP